MNAHLGVVFITLLSFFHCTHADDGTEPASSLLATSLAHTPKQIKEWEKLYPKLNSKMARMEELLNFIDRFLGDEEFKSNVLDKTSEFIYLTRSSKKVLPDYLLDSDKDPFTKALEETASTGEKLYLAIKNDQETEAKSLFLKLDKLRRKGHAKWAE